MEKIKQVILIVLSTVLIGTSGSIGMGVLFENEHMLKAAKKLQEFWLFSKIELTVIVIILTILCLGYKLLKTRNDYISKSAKMNIELNITQQLYRTELQNGENISTLNERYDRITKSIFRKYGFNYAKIISNMKGEK